MVEDLQAYVARARVDTMHKGVDALKADLVGGAPCTYTGKLPRQGSGLRAQDAHVRETGFETQRDGAVLHESHKLDSSLTT